MANFHLIPAGHCAAIGVPRGTMIKVINTNGTQVIDFSAFSISPSTGVLNHQILSIPHTRTALCKIIPEVGDSLVSNERKPMLTIIENTSLGYHDTLIPACDKFRYEQLGVKGYHRSCEDNLVDALQNIGMFTRMISSFMRFPDVKAGIPVPPHTSAPLNLFMNVSVQGKRYHLRHLLVKAQLGSISL